MMLVSDITEVAISAPLARSPRYLRTIAMRTGRRALLAPWLKPFLTIKLTSLTLRSRERT
jgi:hypothetical protein